LTDFGWTRLAYLLIVLSVLAALVQLGSAGADPRPLAAEPPEGKTVAELPPADAKGSHESFTPQVSTAPRAGAAPGGGTAAPAFARHLRRATAGGAAASDPGRAVFYRPAPPSPPPGASAAPGPGPFCGDLGRFPGGHRLVFPLPMGYANSYEDTWGAPRPQGGHEGTDLMAPTGTPEYAVTDGTIVPVTGSNGNGWNTLGGYALMLRAAYSVGPVREGDLFYYAHLEKESALPLGATVRAGQLVGYAGDTGQGPEVTRGLFPPHLHLGWYDAVGTRSYLPSGAMNPYPLLEWITAGGGVLGGGSRARYCEVPRSGAPTPSTGGGHWPAARVAGARPDLDTGSERPAPSPAAGTHQPQAGHANKATKAKPQDRTPGKHSQDAPGRAPLEPSPRAADPATDETPGKPAASGEPPPHAGSPEAEPRERPAGQNLEDGSHAASSTSENEPAEESGHPDEGREPEGEEGKGEEDAANDPGGDADGDKPEEKPGEDPPPSDGVTTPDEGESSSEPDSGDDPETDGSEDTDEEPETTSAPPETTMSE
jgi:murein DD-endopeptidase MepM/ murein hydrolase activator NlpD